METLSMDDIDRIQKQVKYIVDLKRELILTGKIFLNAKHVNELDLVSQTLAGISFYLLGLKRDSIRQETATTNQA